MVSGTAKCISDRSIFSSKFPKQYDSLFDYSRVLSELRPWSCSTNQNKKWLKNVKFRYCKIESKPLWRHVWSWITKLPMLYNLEKTTNVKTKTIFWSEVLQNAWINIVLHWKFWKKYGSVCHLFSCKRWDTLQYHGGHSIFLQISCFEFLRSVHKDSLITLPKF